MKLNFLKIVWVGIFLGFSADFLFADVQKSGSGDTQKPMEAEKMKKTFIFSLLPKAFQSKPVQAISVLTEVTDIGKQLMPPKLGTPAYYRLMVSGYHKEGAGTSQEKSIDRESLVQEVKKSLRAANYLEETKESPASLLLVVVWGEHNREYDPQHRNELARAKLIGGEKWATELAEAIEAQEDSPVRGSQRMPDIMNPVYQFCARNDKNRVLVDQVLDDCYFVVVSAYDLAAYERGERLLLWRTKMTTAAQGVSLAESSTALVASGTNYFGKWMTEVSIVDKRINRKTKIEMGETRTISMDEPAADQQQKPAPPARKK